jgi:hypothetical protein
MGAPPVFVGADHETSELESRFEVAATDVGAPGTVAGVTVPEASESSLVPARFDATTVNA